LLKLELQFVTTGRCAAWIACSCKRTWLKAAAARCRWAISALFSSIIFPRHSASACRSCDRVSALIACACADACAHVSFRSISPARICAPAA
jgi:hypothetical protein